jgi:hypothetical protein
LGGAVRFIYTVWLLMVLFVGPVLITLVLWEVETSFTALWGLRLFLPCFVSGNIW